jgi:hypothetical protein
MPRRTFHLLRPGLVARAGALLLAALVASPSAAQVQPGEPATKPTFKIYGFAQLDVIGDFKRVQPDWKDTLRPTKIPTEPELFGPNGETSLSVKQTRFGVWGEIPAGFTTARAQFEFDLFGVGVNAGQTTIRLRLAYAEYWQFLAGQAQSLFMDGDVFPDIIDYWGPAGMVFLRNPQLRWTPLSGEHSLAVAIEAPGLAIDSGAGGGVDPLLEAQPYTRFPDLTARYRLTGDFGHLQASGVLRWLGYQVLPSATAQYHWGYTTGWGVNLASVVNTWGRDRLRLQAVYGAGIANYMNDASWDVAPQDGAAKAVPLLGLVAYYDHAWSDQFTSSVGWSMTRMWTTDQQDPSAFEMGQYASANLIYRPVPAVMTGAEFLFGERRDKGGASGTDFRFQLSAKVDFAHTW